MDRLDGSTLLEHYPHLNRENIVEVEVVDDAHTLATLGDNSQDFVIGNHLVEHLQNPLLALKNWCRVLKPKGIIFMAVPDKRRTFDRNRPLTPLPHIVADFLASDIEKKELDKAHFREWVTVVKEKRGKAATELMTELIETNWSIHYHVWNWQSFNELIDYVLGEFSLPMRVVDSSPPTNENNEFVFVLEKL